MSGRVARGRFPGRVGGMPCEPPALHRGGHMTTDPTIARVRDRWTAPATSSAPPVARRSTRGTWTVRDRPRRSGSATRSRSATSRAPGLGRFSPALSTVAGQPATAPVGVTLAGLPLGLQAIGPYLEDRTPIRFTRSGCARQQCRVYGERRGLEGARRTLEVNFLGPPPGDRGAAPGPERRRHHHQRHERARCARELTEKSSRRRRWPVSRVQSRQPVSGLARWSFLWAAGYPVALAA
jgi:hypothetical protein